MEKKSIGNVNILDLTKATEESIAEVGHIGNVNVAIVTPETANLLTHLSIGNLNASVEQPTGVVLVKPSIGQISFNHAYFTNSDTRIFPIAIGETTFEPDVTAEDIQKGLSGFIAIGEVICPEPLLGVLQTKAEKLIGDTKTYPLMKQVIFNDLKLDEKTLADLADGSELAVVGGMILPEVLPNDLLAQKFTRLFVSDEVKCHEENAPFLRMRLEKGSGKVKTIPAGYDWVEGDLHLDSSTLAIGEARKIYCTGRVVFDTDLTPEIVDKSLVEIACESMMFAPQTLKGVLSPKVDIKNTHITFYEGELWWVDDARNLPSSRFDYLQGKATLVVEGVLTVEPEVDPKLLAERLAKVHNYGVINCTSAQMGALQARLGIHDGVIAGPIQAGDEDEDQNMIGNANYLSL